MVRHFLCCIDNLIDKGTNAHLSTGPQELVLDDTCVCLNPQCAWLEYTQLFFPKEKTHPLPGPLCEICTLRAQGALDWNRMCIKRMNDHIYVTYKDS
jgi:hypothetical protein